MLQRKIAISNLTSHNRNFRGCYTSLHQPCCVLAIACQWRNTNPTLPSSPLASTSRLTSISKTTSSVRSPCTTKRTTTRRYLHTTPPNSFIPFFGLQRPSTASRYAKEFLDSLSAGDVSSITSSYYHLRESLFSSTATPPDPSTVPSHHDLSQALLLLKETSFIHRDFQALQDIFNDIRDLWGHSWTGNDHHSYVVGLTKAQRLKEAGDWLDRMSGGLPKSLTGKLGTGKQVREEATVQGETRIEIDTYPPSIDDWNIYLSGLLRCAVRQERMKRHKTNDFYSHMKRVVLDRMSASKRDRTTWNTLLAAVFAHSERVRDSRDSQQQEQERQQVLHETTFIRKQMEKDGCQEHSVTLSIILGGFIDLELYDSAEQIKGDIVRLGDEGKNVLDLQAWNMLVKHSCRTEGMQAGYDTVKRMQEAGLKPDTSTFEILFTELMRLASPSMTVEKMRTHLSDLESLTGVLMTHEGYALAISRVDSFDDAMQLYHDSQRDGVPVSSNILRMLLERAQSHSPEHTDPGRFREHLKSIQMVYNDLLSSRLSDERSIKGIHDIEMYTALLQYCARSDVRELQWAITLLEDVRANDLSFPGSHVASLIQGNSVTAASIVIALMKNATNNHSEAFKSYSWTIALDPNSIFTYDDFYDIIRTFSDLEFPLLSQSSQSSTGSRRSYCPPSIYFAFFDDMSKCGLSPGSRIYQAVLHYYAREGLLTPASAEAVRQIHDLIKMDQYTDPDIHLMNRLMFAYSKTGNLIAALGVWRAILVNKLQFNNVSVSIVLDVYGYSGAYRQLLDLWKGLKRQGFNLNKKNLESYIEALGRLGRSNEAVETVFREAKQNGKGDIEIDERTFEILLKFVRSRSEVYEEVKHRIENEFPRLWQEVKLIASSAINAERRVKPFQGEQASNRDEEDAG